MSEDPGPVELSTDDLRAVARFAAECAAVVLPLFEDACPGDPRPGAAIEAATAFAEGAPRGRLQRAVATAAHRAATECADPAGRETARAAGHAAGAAYLHPLARATQVRHILGSAACAARALELAALSGGGQRRRRLP